MKPIYQMNYEEFRDHCWHRWGITIGMGYVTDCDGRVVDHRTNETTVQTPTIRDDGTVDFMDTKIRKFRRLREAIEYVSKSRKLYKPYFRILEKEMKKYYGEKENV